MKTNHTLGPWFIEDGFPSSKIGYRAIVSGDGETICSPSPMGGANAALISSAPELLAALEAITACVDRNGGSIRTISVESIMQARVAILKARGE